MQQPTNAYAFPPGHLNPYNVTSTTDQFGLSQDDSPTFIISAGNNYQYPNYLCNLQQFQNMSSSTPPPPPPHQIHHGFNTQQSLTFSSTSDEADDQQLSCIIHERKQRRMISNRESARRSRMRKQKHLDELWSQVVSLRNENRQLLDKLNHASEYNEKVVEENAQLKEEASELRQMLMIHMKLINSPSCPSFADDDQFPAPSWSTSS